MIFCTMIANAMPTIDVKAKQLDKQRRDTFLLAAEQHFKAVCTHSSSGILFSSWFLRDFCKVLQEFRTVSTVVHGESLLLPKQRMLLCQGCSNAASST